MKLRFSKRDTLIVSITVLLLVLLIVYAQFLKLSPLESDLDMKKQSLKTEEKLLEVMKQKQMASTKQIVENTKELQKKVPVKPLQQQIILDLEQAENVSNSQILSMSFALDGTVTVEHPEADTANGSPQPNADANQTADQQQGTNGQADQTNQPAGAETSTLKKMTVQLSVESPDYEAFEKFVNTLESLNRIVVVEAINYAGGQEITSLDQKPEKLSYSLTVSAYYMPELDDLLVDLPKIDAPVPAGKTNPLSQFAPTVQTQP